MGKSSKIFSLALGLGLVVIVGTGYAHQQHIASSNRDDAHTELVSAKKYKADRIRYTPSHVKHEYDANHLNLSKFMNDNNKRLKKGFTVAFNDCHTNSAFHHNSKKVVSLLGKDVGQRTLEVVAPPQGDSPMIVNGVSHSPSQNISDVQIGYGHYDESTQTIPVNINVEYTSIPFNANFQTQNGSKTSHTGRVVYQGEMSSNGSIQLSHEYSFIDGAPS